MHVIEEIREPSSALREVYNECEHLRVQASTDATRIRSLEAELLEAKATIEQLWVRESAMMAEEVDRLKQALAKESQKAKKFWKQKCDLMLRHEDEIDAKDTEIAVLKTRILAISASRVEQTSDMALLPGSGDMVLSTAGYNLGGHTRRGKAPPVEPFTGERPDVLWEDWIPTLERAAGWNGW